MSAGPRNPPSPPAAPRAQLVSYTNVPGPGEPVSQALKDRITNKALGLLEEQVQARIVHYKAELETNPELDAITAQVVAGLREMQAKAQSAAEGRTGSAGRDAIRASHEKILRTLLDRAFRTDAPSMLVERRLKDIHRKLARLFFQSELHDKTLGRDGAAKVIQHGEQAVFYVLMRYQHRLRNELDAFEYTSEDIRERARDLLAKFSKEMQDSFLSRRSSELKRIVAVFHSVLVDFACKQIAPVTAEFAREVIRQSGSFEGKAFPYKISTEGFGRFRSAFERQLMEHLVEFAEDQLVERLADTAGVVRNETIQFITDPRVFSMICGELCDGLYEFFCNEGFLDLPSDWRNAAASGATA